MEEIPQTKTTAPPRVPESGQKDPEKKRKATKPTSDLEPIPAPAEKGEKVRKDQKRAERQEGRTREKNRDKEGKPREKERDYKGLADDGDSDDERKKKRGRV